MYLLDFNKRVTRESVKNFQLGDEKDEVILQFGRKGDNSFIMDFKYPLSPLQAFGICLTSVERKFGCQ
jgi:tubby-related protein 1